MTELLHVPLMKTKLFVPHLLPQLVRRPRITALLNTAMQYPFTLVSSLAGSGKTTTLVEWVNQLDLPVAWFSIDEGDNDFSRFLLYFVHALQAIVPGTGEAVLEALRSTEALNPDNIAALLVNDLTATTDFVLILDDYHLIHARAIHATIQLFIEHLPPHIHLVIATRADPNLPLARLRARNKVLELRIDHLRFTPAEVAEYFNQVMQFDLSEKDINLLEMRTEGWIASLQMAALSLKRYTDPTTFLQAFSGNHRYIIDYLAEEVLNCLPQAVQAFLLQTCILNRMCAALCDAVTGQENGQEMLEYLDRNNVFLVPLDEERGWFRYHHLFTDLLRARLARIPQGQNQKTLHLRASIWYQHNGFAEDAIRHALAAGEFQRAAQLVEAIAENAWLNGQYTSILAWIRALPKELVQNRPWLCIWNVWALTQAGTLQEARAWMDAAQQAVSKLDVTSSDVVYELTILQALLAGLAQDYDRAIELTRPVLENPPNHSTKTALLARCNISHGLSSMYYACGELDKTEQNCLETLRISKEIGFTLRYLHAVNKLAYVYKTTGQLRRSFRLLQETLSLLQEQGQPNHFAAGVVYCRLMDVLHEWDRIAEVQQVLDEHLKPELLAEVPYLLVDRCNALARDSLLKQDIAAAQIALHKANALAQHSYIWPGLTWQTERLQVRLWLQTGDIALAESWIAEQPAHPSDASKEFSFANESREMLRVRILLAKGSSHAALGLLDGLAASAEAGGRKGSLVEIWVLEALALQRAGETERAVAALERVLALAEPEGYQRMFLDEGSPIAVLLAKMIQYARSQHVPYALRLLKAFEKEQITPSPAIRSTAQREPLTRREVEVLRCMAAGLSNSETACKLVIETSTVKRHINNIFAKLGVENRVQAINKAKELNLL